MAECQAVPCWQSARQCGWQTTAGTLWQEDAHFPWSEGAFFRRELCNMIVPFLPWLPRNSAINLVFKKYRKYYNSSQYLFTYWAFICDILLMCPNASIHAICTKCLLCARQLSRGLGTPLWSKQIKVPDAEELPFWWGRGEKINNTNKLSYTLCWVEVNAGDKNKAGWRDGAWGRLSFK